MIRDRRTTNRYFVDNTIVDDYGVLLGPAGVAVYNVLCRHANLGQQSCFPAVPTIARKLGISEGTVRESLKTMRKLGLIAISERRDDDGAQMSNEYVLLDPPVRVPPSKLDTRPRYPDLDPNNPNSEQSTSIIAPLPEPKPLGTTLADADQETAPPLEPDYVPLDDEGYPAEPDDPLASYIEAESAMHGVPRKLTRAQKLKLKQRVQLAGKYASPSFMFQHSPGFKEWVRGQIVWASGAADGNRKPTSSLISAIRNYEREGTGWLEFKQRWEEGAREPNRKANRGGPGDHKPQTSRDEGSGDTDESAAVTNPSLERIIAIFHGTGPDE